MKVRDLIEILKTLPQDVHVLTQRDSEGNGYNSVYGADSDAYVINSEIADNGYLKRGADVHIAEDLEDCDLVIGTLEYEVQQVVVIY